MASKYRFGAVSEKQEAFFASQFEKTFNNIKQLIESGNLEKWEKTWICAARPVNYVTRKAYTGGMNTMILEFARLAHGYKHSQWAGSGQVRQAGGRVKSEEKENSHAIFVPKFATKIVEKNGKEQEEKILVGWNVFSVYNLDQCENVVGLPVEEFKNEKHMGAEELLAMNPHEVVFGGDSAAYSPSCDCIMMPSLEAFKSSEAYYATYFHELTHWSGAEHRLRRDMSTMFGSERYGKEELVAELGAALMKARCGIDDGNANAAAYIAHWWGEIGEDITELFSAYTKALKAVEYLTTPKQE